MNRPPTREQLLIEATTCPCTCILRLERTQAAEACLATRTHHIKVLQPDLVVAMEELRAMLPRTSNAKASG